MHERNHLRKEVNKDILSLLMSSSDSAQPLCRCCCSLLSVTRWTEKMKREPEGKTSAHRIAVSTDLFWGGGGVCVCVKGCEKVTKMITMLCCKDVGCSIYGLRLQHKANLLRNKMKMSLKQLFNKKIKTFSINRSLWLAHNLPVCLHDLFS